MPDDLLRTCSILPILAIACHGFAQELVPNGRFEQHTGCPTGQNQLYKADGWIDPSYWTPDYFHVCGTAGYSAPDNAGGHQVPRSDSAYAGIFLYSASPVREYIETALLSPLVTGQTYFFEMFMNLLDNSKFSARNIGVYFSDTLVNSSGINFMPFTPQILNTGTAYPDTVDWYPVTGYYTAHGGESYMIIGNFDGDEDTPLLMVNPDGFAYAVVYIDDISLTASTGLTGPSSPAIRVAPMPFDAELDVFMPGTDVSDILLCDMSARVRIAQRATGSAHLRTGELAAGAYLLIVRHADGQEERAKVLKL